MERTDYIRYVLIICGAITIAIFSTLAYLNSRGSPTRTAQTVDESKLVILSGEYTCLPHTDGSKAKECSPGIKSDTDEYHALDLGALIDASSSPKLKNGEKILAAGEIVPIEAISSDQWKQYPIKGIMRVLEIATQ